MATSKEKGDILEDLVGLLHDGVGEHVQVRTELPSIHNDTRTREIDVLLTTDILGLPIRTVFECKNYGTKIGIERIDAFAGVLDDVGVPNSHGVFVSPIGYTKGAQARAADAGIRTLRFDGLTPDRLAAEVNIALQSLVYLVATWRQLTKFDYLPQSARSIGPGIQADLDPTRHGNGEAALLHVLWEQWLAGSIPSTLETHVISINNPSGGLVIAEVDVSAHLAVLEGTATHLALTQPEGVIERMRIQAKYTPPGSRIELIPFNTDDELREHFSKGSIHAYSTVRVPKLASTVSFWPPSEEVVERLRERIKRGQTIDFESVEGRNILNAWARPWHPPPVE